MRSDEWAAGLFEGEGCFTLGRGPERRDGTRRTYLRVALGSVDRDVVQSFAGWAGGGSVTSPQSQTTASGKPFYRWETSGVTAEALAMRLRPHLHTRRVERLDHLLQEAHRGVPSD